MEKSNSASSYLSPSLTEIKKPMKELAFDLDSAQGRLICRESTFENITVLLQDLCEEIDSTKKGDVRCLFPQFQRMAQVISELMSYNMDEMIEDMKELKKVNQEICDFVQKK